MQELCTDVCAEQRAQFSSFDPKGLRSAGRFAAAQVTHSNDDKILRQHKPDGAVLFQFLGKVSPRVLLVERRH